MNQLHTFVGNVVADPELRQTKNGIPVLQMRIAVDDRYRDSDGAWQSRPSHFWTVQAWRELAEQIAARVKRGDQLVVVGEFRTESWKDNGQPRSRTFILATNVGLDLARRSAPQQAAGDPNGTPAPSADHAEPEPADWHAE